MCKSEICDTSVDHPSLSVSTGLCLLSFVSLTRWRQMSCVCRHYRSRSLDGTIDADGPPVLRLVHRESFLHWLGAIVSGRTSQRSGRLRSCHPATIYIYIYIYIYYIWYIYILRQSKIKILANIITLASRIYTHIEAYLSFFKVNVILHNLLRTPHLCLVLISGWAENFQSAGEKYYG